MQGKSNSGAPLIRSDGDGKTAKGSSFQLEEKSGEVIIDQKQRRKSEESKDIQSKKRPKRLRL